jgi:fibronectin-binding autotransporter adhesin
LAAQLADNGIGATSVTKSGTGTWVLTGANTYAGATTVSLGTLLINGSSSGTGATTVAACATFGHTGNTALSLGGALTLSDNSFITLSLGAPGVNSSLARTGGVWAFDANQAFTFDNLGATVGTYSGLITGLIGTETGISTISTWGITNAGWKGTFSYSGGSVNLDLTAIAVPEPSTWVLLALGLTTMVIFRRRRIS